MRFPCGRAGRCNSVAASETCGTARVRRLPDRAFTTGQQLADIGAMAPEQQHCDGDADPRIRARAHRVEHAERQQQRGRECSERADLETERHRQPDDRQHEAERPVQREHDAGRRRDALAAGEAMKHRIEWPTNTASAAAATVQSAAPSMRRELARGEHGDKALEAIARAASAPRPCDCRCAARSSRRDCFGPILVRVGQPERATDDDGERDRPDQISAGDDSQRGKHDRLETS